jgi:Zn-dependent protease with chaperone function
LVSGDAGSSGVAVSLAASPAHRRQVLGLLAGLLGFAAVYVALVLGCVAAPVLLISAARAQPWLWGIAGPATLVFAVLLLVLVRGLVHRPQAGQGSIEVSAGEQPRLFAFVDGLAADAGAAMPDAIRLSPGVNAAMLRSSSALGLLFGGRRELVVGVGLIHVVDVAELEAILAHELGHFAQSSARLGQWAHRTSLVLRAIVLERDQLDERLARARASASVLRRGLAWLPALGIAGIRAILARVLAALTRSSLGLARELEFNADRHAVARCGSDAIVAALWRAQRGALAMDASLAALRELSKHGLISEDLYVHVDARWAEFEAASATEQDREHAQDRVPAADTMLAALRRPYLPGPTRHFPPGEVPAEILGYSHPSYAEREAHAKDPYRPGPAAPPDGWPPASTLLDQLAQVRADATALAYAQLGIPSDAPRQPAADVEARLAEELAEREQDRRYFGLYSNRIVAVGRLSDEGPDPTELDHLRAAAAPWRGGPALMQFMQRWRATEAALDQLRARCRAGERSPETLALLRAAEGARTREQLEAEAGDLAVLAWMAAIADNEQRRELELRASFLAFVQDRIITLNGHRSAVMPLLSDADPEARRTELELALADLHADLDATLRAAEAHPLPDLQHLEAGASTREFLLVDPLLPEWDPRGREPLRAWLGRFLPQVTRVHDRLRTLHYKNLGRLLELFERIELGSECGQSVSENAD